MRQHGRGVAKSLQTLLNCSWRILRRAEVKKDGRPGDDFMRVPPISAMLRRLLASMQPENRKGRHLWRQGDVFIARVDAIPERAQRSPLPHGILVHGELTGHSHRLENPRSAMLFSGTHGNGELYLDVPADGTRIVHEEHG